MKSWSALVVLLGSSCRLLVPSYAFSVAMTQQQSSTAASTSTTASSIRPGTWKFREQEHPIAYEYVQGRDKDATPVLLLNGFGMSSFHQHRLMDALQNEWQKSKEESNSGRSIYAIDYLGQGKSWPKDCNDGTAKSEQGLRYCGMTWVEQIVQFIEQEIPNQKVHLVGNSVGGHLSVFVAAHRPDLIESVTLLNATPVWGLNLPGWSGHLPPPPLPKMVGRFLFDRMRDRNTIEEFLDTTYVNKAAYDELLVEDVQSSTDGPGGHAAFASILWSPPITVPLPCGTNDEATFYDCLNALQCDVLLCFGREDPWCKPVFAKRMLQILQKRQSCTGAASQQRYVELSDVGHCPNHEAATATANVLATWLACSSSRQQLELLPDGPRTVRESWGETVVRELREDEISLSMMDQLAVQFL